MATKAAAYWRKCCRDPSAWDFLSLAQLRLVVSSRPSPAKKYAHGEPPSQKKKKLGRISSFLALGSTKNWASHISASHQDLFPPLSRTKVPSSTHQAAHIHWWHILYLRLKTNLRDLKLKLCAERVRKSSYIDGLCQTHAFQLPVFLAAASYRIDLVR